MTLQEIKNTILYDISVLKELVYDKCSFQLTDPVVDKESQEYSACTFEINKLKIVSRVAKITPTKTGQFATLWKRIAGGPIQPYHMGDEFDFVVVAVKKEDVLGQFVFPKLVLLNKRIISSDTQEGKRAFRVYPPWDETTSDQAKRTQKWQLGYFLSIGQAVDINRAKKLYSTN